MGGDGPRSWRRRLSPGGELPATLSRLSRHLALAVLLWLALARVAPAQDSRLTQLFIDAEDRRPDLSRLLARGGFIPMPIIITEPAVDNGFGIAGYFIKAHPGGTPTRTILGAAKTGNGSEGFGFMRSGPLMDEKLLYSISIGKGLAVMDFYPGNRDASLTYNNDIRFAAITARYRLGESGFSFGPALRYRSNDLALETGGAYPQIEALLGRTITLPSLGLALHYDDRDNPMSPTQGTNMVAEIQRFDKRVGSDIEFTSTSLFAARFATRDSWTLGLMGRAETVSDGAPFFMKPDIELRGLSRSRYRGDQVAMAEAELRRQVSPRWGVLGFAGYGRAFGEGDADAVTYGLGIRYRIAQLLGLDIGLDYAKGPEEGVFYIQFGHAWGRSMD